MWFRDEDADRAVGQARVALGPPGDGNPIFQAAIAILYTSAIVGLFMLVDGMIEDRWSSMTVTAGVAALIRYFWVLARSRGRQVIAVERRQKGEGERK